MKCWCSTAARYRTSRSREGAWIEIAVLFGTDNDMSVAPARERGLKYMIAISDIVMVSVAPARERGLKSAMDAG